MDSTYEITTWTDDDRDEVIGLILPIQRVEFGIDITVEDQPDLVDVAGVYLAPGGGFWVARRDGRVVGTIAAIVVEANTVAIRKMFVDPAERGTGLAAHLLDALEAWSRRAGFRTLLLGTTSVMHGAQRFYARHGFTEIDAASLPDAFPRMSVDSMFFRRDLLGVVAIRPYDGSWPELFTAERARIVGALGGRAVRVEHAGSTSVPGLAAKPVIDITLCVSDSADEPAYVPALEQVGYSFILREPEWYQHRLLTRDWPRINLHVFNEGCSEAEDMVGFRDWLRTHPEDRDLYERTKRDLAGRDWAIVQDYADAKTEVVLAIKQRAGLGTPR